jgi:3'(2'), 5'-bisphosphate nucleotidase
MQAARRFRERNWNEVPMTCDRASLLTLLAGIAAEAGERIMAIRSRGHGVSAKADGSPLTEADLAAEEVIATRLAAALPGLPVVSEEAASHPALTPGAAFLLVDPLDGTREFLGPSGEFTVNIALVEGGRPVAGVVHAPALGRLWLGALGEGAAAFEVEPGQPLVAAPRRPLQVRCRADQGWVAVASRSHLDPETEAFLAGLPVAERRSIGSSLKFCLVAEGEADLYPRFGTTMEWDTAAGHAVLEAAGGRVDAPDGGAFVYGKASAGFRNGAFVAWGAPPGSQARSATTG